MPIDHYTTKQAAQLLGLAPCSITQRARDYPDIGSKFGHVWKFTDADLEKIRARKDKRGNPNFRRGIKRGKVAS